MCKSCHARAYLYSRKEPEEIKHRKYKEITRFPIILPIEQAPPEQIDDPLKIYIGYVSNNLFSYRTQLSDIQNGLQPIEIGTDELLNTLQRTYQKKSQREALDAIKSTEELIRHIQGTDNFPLLPRALSRKEHFDYIDALLTDQKEYINKFSNFSAYIDFFNIPNDLVLTRNLAGKAPNEIKEITTALERVQSVVRYRELQRQGSIYDPRGHNWEVNAKWLSGLIEMRRPVQIHSPPTEANMWRTNNANGEEYSALAKEITGLILVGRYTPEISESSVMLFQKDPHQDLSFSENELHQKICQLTALQVLEGIHKYRILYLSRQGWDINECRSLLSAMHLGEESLRNLTSSTTFSDLSRMDQDIAYHCIFTDVILDRLSTSQAEDYLKVKEITLWLKALIFEEAMSSTKIARDIQEVEQMVSLLSIVEQSPVIESLPQPSAADLFHPIPEMAENLSQTALQTNSEQQDGCCKIC